MSTPSTRAFPGIALALGLGLAAAPALAQSAEDKLAAEALFDQAKKLFLEKNYPEACPRFERSQRLDPGIGTLLYLADCYENQGRLASAWVTFREAASAAKAAGQGDRETVARSRAALLEPKLFRLTIRVDAPDTPGLAIRRNGSNVRREVWGEAVPVDPGEIAIEASAPGKVTWSMKIQVPAGAGAKAIVIPALAAGAGTTEVAPPPDAPAEGPAPGQGQRVAGLAVGGVGVVGLALGATFGGLAISKNNAVKEACPVASDPCDPATVKSSRQAGTFADVSTAMFVVGGAALAAGIIVYFTAPSRREPARAWATPLIGAGTAGVVAGGSF
jgi:hypothetical protein